MTLAKIRGPYIQRERRYVIEWASITYPNYKAFFNLRVGLAPEAMRAQYPGIDVERLGRVFKKFVDYVGVGEKEVLLVEGKLRTPITAIGQLIIYRDQLFTTPEMQPYKGMPLRTILLCPVNDPSLDLMLRDVRIEKAFYRPAWVYQYLKEVNR
jgi:hypothetical protein